MAYPVHSRYYPCYKDQGKKHLGYSTHLAGSALGLVLPPQHRLIYIFAKLRGRKILGSLLNLPRGRVQILPPLLAYPPFQRGRGLLHQFL